ncbi:MAG: DapH/DapD/GlmU-related protein [Nanoarchaeota archaeon]|nr:DapH/DapD/GlmU-related protein [Nanoarchaeota archaeon]
MMGKINLFLVKNFVTPFYKSRNRPLILVGGVLRNFLIFIYKCDISPSADIPYSTRFPHYYGISIAACKIGENCLIRQNTTIGGKFSYSLEEGKKRKTITMEERRKVNPVIGSHVDIGANTCILGPVKVGDHAVIGAGSVVLEDVEPYSVYSGVPAKKIKVLPRAGGNEHFRFNND